MATSLNNYREKINSEHWDEFLELAGSLEIEPGEDFKKNQQIVEARLYSAYLQIEDKYPNEYNQDKSEDNF